MQGTSWGQEERPVRKLLDWKAVFARYDRNHGCLGVYWLFVLLLVNFMFISLRIVLLEDAWHGKVSVLGIMEKTEALMEEKYLTC